MAAWYCGSTKWSAVTQWAAATAYSVGDLRRQLASPTVGQERVFRCTTAGTSGGSEPAWTLTKGGTTNDNTAVWTEVTGNSTYGWSAAHARVENMFSWMAAGDDGYVSASHTQTAAATLNMTVPGTGASPCRVICVDDSAAPPTALSTGAVVAITGDFNTLGFRGQCYWYGITFRAGTSNNNPFIQFCNTDTAPQWHRCQSCAFELLGTGTAGAIVIAPTNSNPRQGLTEWIDCTVKFSATQQFIEVYHQLIWRGSSSSIQGATIPTTLFAPHALQPGGGRCLVQAVDLSAAGSGKNLVSVAQAIGSEFRFLDCKLGASVSVTTGTHAGRGGTLVEVINCDSADTNYRFQRTTYQATETQETTIVRSGGASDGTTTVARKVVTTANAKAISPYESLWIEYWNETVGSAITVTVPVLTDNVTLTDADAWLEVQYLGTSGVPLGSLATDATSDLILGTPANQATDGSSSWTTTGLGTPVKQTLDVTVTPQEKGLIRARVCVAKASTTVYYDPLLQVA